MVFEIVSPVKLLNITLMVFAPSAHVSCEYTMIDQEINPPVIPDTRSVHVTT